MNICPRKPVFPLFMVLVLLLIAAKQSQSPITFVIGRKKEVTITVPEMDREQLAAIGAGIFGTNSEGIRLKLLEASEITVILTTTNGGRK